MCIQEKCRRIWTTISPTSPYSSHSIPSSNSSTSSSVCAWEWRTCCPESRSLAGAVHWSDLSECIWLPVVLRKFGLKLIQTRFEPNQNQVSSFQFGKFLPKLNGLISGFSLLKFLKRFQIRFKPQTVCTYNFFLIFTATVNCFIVYLILIYIYITLILKCIY